MDRRQLESAGELYPYMHLQGLYAVPFGLVLWFFVGVANLERTPGGGWLAGTGMAVALAALGAVSLYYQRTFGRVTPTQSRMVRYFAASAGATAAFVAVDQLGRAIFGRPPDRPISTTVVAWAIGMFVFYAVAGALKAHHVVIWSALFIAGVLPIWGNGVDRDAIAYFPIGAGCIVAGLLDHRDLVRTFRSYDALQLEDGNVGA